MRLGILTDIHHCPPGSPPSGWHNPHHFDDALERFQSSIAWLETQGVDRLAVLGDLTHFGDEASLREVLAVIGGSSLPTWILTGNHDLNPDHAALERVLGRDKYPTVQVIEGERDDLGADWMIAGLRMDRGANGSGYMATALAVDSWGGAPAIVLSHFPLLSTAQTVKGAGLKYAGDLSNASDIASTLVTRSAPTIAISGHLHVRHATTDGAVLQVSCGALIESLFEATIFDFSAWNDGYVSWQATPMQAIVDEALPILSEGEQRWSWDGTRWASAENA